MKSTVISGDDTLYPTTAAHFHKPINLFSSLLLLFFWFHINFRMLKECLARRFNSSVSSTHNKACVVGVVKLETNPNTSFSQVCSSTTPPSECLLCNFYLQYELYVLSSVQGFSTERIWTQKGLFYFYWVDEATQVGMRGIGWWRCRPFMRNIELDGAISSTVKILLNCQSQ